MYLEALQDYIYEKSEHNWQQAKKGPRPQPPEGYHERQFNTLENSDLPRDESGRPIPKDIMDMYDVGD